MSIIEQLNLLTPYLVFWAFLFGISYNLEKNFAWKKSSFRLTTAVLNLLETFFLQSFGLLFILSTILLPESVNQEIVAILLRSTIAFYFVESLFQLFSRTVNLGMITHHLVSIYGASMMLINPHFYLESCILLMLTKISFQHSVQLVFRYFDWKSASFLRVNAWWNLFTFSLCRGLLIPIGTLYALIQGILPLSLLIPLLMLIIWGIVFIPKVQQNTSRFLNNA